MPACAHTAVRVRFQTAVVQRDGTVARESAWQSNLILDQGLDRAAVEQWCDLFKAAAVGSGTLVIKRHTDGVTFSRSGATVTASAAFFESDDAGRLFKFDSGEEMYITAYTDSTHVTVGTSGTIAADEGTLWYVNSTSLHTEVKRTQTYSGGGSANGTTISGDTLTFKRTFIFSPETGTVTYREVGWSWTNTPAGGLFGMAPLHASTQTLEDGESFQVVIQMSLVLTPNAPTPIADTSGGAWNTAGNLMIESLGSAVSTVATNGTTVNGNALEPSAGLNFRAVLATWTQSLEIVTSALGWLVSTTAVAMTLQSYTNGSFERALTGSFNPTQANGTIYGFGFDAGNRTLSIKFTAAQTKLAANGLNVVFKRTWQRALSNVIE